MLSARFGSDDLPRNSIVLNSMAQQASVTWIRQFMGQLCYGSRLNAIAHPLLMPFGGRPCATI